MDFIIDEEFRSRNRKPTKQERTGLERLIEDEGCAKDCLTVALLNGERILCDGHTTFDICKEKGKPLTDPRCLLFDSRQDVLDWIDRRAKGRRNLTPEEMAENRNERIERVAAARKEGKSTRAIAEDEGVSQRTILDDIKDATDDPPSVDVNSSNHTTSENVGKTTVIGKDGRTRPAKMPKKPLCTRCERNERIGKEVVKGCDMCAQLRPKSAPKVTKASDVVLDSFGVDIPKRCRDAWADPWLQKAIDFLGVAVAGFWTERLADGLARRKKAYPFFDAKEFADGCGQAGHDLEKLLDHLKDNRPAGVCPACAGEGCPACKMSGLVPRGLHKELAKKAKVEK